MAEANEQPVPCVWGEGRGGSLKEVSVPDCVAKKSSADSLPVIRTASGPKSRR